MFIPLRWFLLVTLGWLSVNLTLHADEPSRPKEKMPLPPLERIGQLSAYPETVRLRGLRSGQQLVITATLTDQQTFDLTRHATYEIGERDLVRITPGGYLTAQANGQTYVLARYGAHTVRIPVQIEACESLPPVDFVTTVAPLFTRLGCNASACHGQASGTNGLELSPQGRDTEGDYATLVRGGRGRWLLPAGPEFSLLLLKATGALPHQGGRRLEVGSADYNLLRRWIQTGVPFRSSKDVRLSKIRVHPQQGVLSPNSQQQLAVTAHFSDGSTLDVTRLAHYVSSTPGLAGVDATGLLSTSDGSGPTVICIHYGQQTTAFRLVIPTTEPVPAYAFHEHTLIDRHLHKLWQQAGVVPAGPCSDEQFLRRVTLDLTGLVPTPAQVRAFLADPAADKRDKLIDQLLASEDYGIHFANIWADQLLIPQVSSKSKSYEAIFFWNWLRGSIAADLPYDRFVRSLVEATGDAYHQPATYWYQLRPRPEQLAEDTARLFLGVRVDCLRCHQQRPSGWNEEDYWGLAAFFGRLEKKKKTVHPRDYPRRSAQVERLTYRPGTVGIYHPQSGRLQLPHLPGQKPFQLAPREDARHVLFDWILETERQYLARTLVLRYWQHFFGRELIPAATDGSQNPSIFDELLDELVQDVLQHDYSLKHLVRTICQSQAYQLGSAPPAASAAAVRLFAQYQPRPLPREQLFAAASQILQLQPKWKGLPEREPHLQRCRLFRDAGFRSRAFDHLSTARAGQLCSRELPAPNETEQVQLAQELLNGDRIHGQLRHRGGRADMLARDPRPHADKVAEVFLWVLGRLPTEEQKTGAVRFVEGQRDRTTAYADLLWALLQTREFVFQQ